MTEDTKLVEESIEEEVIEEESENDKTDVKNIEFEDNDSKPELPLGYERKLSTEEVEEEEEPFFKRNIKKTIEYLDGKSRKVVSGALIVFLISIVNFIAWNFTESTNLEYLGTFLSFLLLLSCAAGILISYNVYTSELNENNDIRISGLILSTGSVLLTVFVIFYEISQNPCLLELREINCDVYSVNSLRAITAVSVFAGSLGIVMLIYGLGLLRKGLIGYALAIAFGGSLILTIVLLMSAFEWIEKSVWLLLIPLLFLGMGLAGLHHRRYQLAGFVIGCYISGLAGIGWLIEPNLASGGFLGGGLPMTGSGLLFILRRTDREAREKMLENAEQLLEDGYPSRSLDSANRLMRRAQQDGVLMQDSRIWLSKARALTGHREYERAITYYSMALEIEEKKALVEEQEEQLKPEIYLSRKEQADREMNDRFIRFLDKAWRLFTGQPKWPLNFIGIIFGIVIGLLFIFAFYGIIVFPIRELPERIIYELILSREIDTYTGLFRVSNLCDTEYELIQDFPMPGRTWQFTLTKSIIDI